MKFSSILTIRSRDEVKNVKSLQTALEPPVKFCCKVNVIKRGDFSIYLDGDADVNCKIRRILK